MILRCKLQASSLTACPGDDRMNLERNNMDTTQLKRIADALEEILRLVKEDQEKMRKINEEKTELTHINLKEKYASLEPDPND
jgi:uncharacterized membrane protein